MSQSKNQVDILQMFVERLEEKVKQDKLYDSAETLSFTAAVEIASQRLKATLKFDRRSPGFAFFEGWMHFQEYLPEPYSDSDVQDLVVRAKGDYRAYRVLKFIAMLARKRTDLPSLAQWHVADQFGAIERPKSPRGRSELANLHRDVLIVREIERLTKAGFAATRNKVSQRTSAIDVIVAALTECRQALSYDAVETIWSRRNSLPRLPFGPELIEELVKMIPSS